MLHSRYTEEELNELIWEQSSYDGKLTVVNRSSWEDKLGYAKYNVVVNDKETGKHFRVYFNRYTSACDFIYTVNPQTPEVKEKVISYKAWVDIESCGIIE